MNQLKMKIVDWDEQSMSLIIKFVSDINDFDIDEAVSLAFQPLTMFPSVEDNQELLKRVAVSGIHLCEMAAIASEARKKVDRLEYFKNLRGQVFEYTVDELVNMDRNNQLVNDIPQVEQEEIYVC